MYLYLHIQKYEHGHSQEAAIFVIIPPFYTWGLISPLKLTVDALANIKQSNL